MDIRSIRSRAADHLAAAPGQPRRVAAAYAGAACLLSIGISLVTYLLDTRISSTGGLSSLGTRAMLSTMQSVLPLLQALIMLCLTMGYRIAVLRMARRQETSPAELTQGFHLFGPALRMALLEALLYIAVGIVAIQLGSIFFLMLPSSAKFYSAMQSTLNTTSILSGEPVIDEALLYQMADAIRPMMLIVLGLFVLLALPIVYRYRLADYVLADEPRRGALYAMRSSRQMLRGNVIRLFRLDLSFWWYYLAEALIGVLAYGDLLLATAGVAIPWSNTVSFYLFYGVSLIAQFVLYFYALNRVSVTYAETYEALRPRPQTPCTVEAQ